MSAHNYWNNGQEDSYSGRQDQPNYDAYPTSHDHSQQHQPQQYSQEYSQDNEPVNWGYGSGHQPEQTQPYQNYDDSQGSTHYGSQQYPPHDPNQGYGQPYQNYSQGQESYQTHNTYGDAPHSPQPPPYGSDTRDYSHSQTTTHYQSSQYQQSGYAPQAYQRAPGQADGERGLLGAIGGAAAGGFAGHQVNHGFIGAVGGAYAGHKLEEHMKDKKKKEKKQKHHGGHGSSSSSSSSSSDDEKKKHKKYGAAAVAGGAVAYGHHQHHQHHGQHHGHHQGGHHGHDRGVNTAGNFSGSSSQISLDRDYDLIAACATLDKTTRLSSINLNDCLANEWGHLRWVKGGGFGATARNVRLIDGGRGLEAELGDGKGGWNVSRILLDERITNNNGDLQFLH